MDGRLPRALSIKSPTGRELWRFSPERGNRGRPVGVSRGLALWRDGAEQRLMFTAGHTLHAIDPATGKLITKFGDEGRVDLRGELDHAARGLDLAANAPGAIYRDLIILGMRVGEGPAPAAPGHIRAYDVRTGKRRWIFHTIPHPGEYGYDTWSPDSWKTVGGANCWAGLVVDRERGLVFVPTGSAAFDFWGGDRLGESPELTAQGGPPTGTENYGGPVVTAGGVLFIAATKDRGSPGAPRLVSAPLLRRRGRARLSHGPRRWEGHGVLS